MHETEAVELISSGIRGIRGERVMLDSDLAQLYGVKTERLNQQALRNMGRFPRDFMFRLEPAEWRSMFVKLQVHPSAGVGWTACRCRSPSTAA